MTKAPRREVSDLPVYEFFVAKGEMGYTVLVRENLASGRTKESFFDGIEVSWSQADKIRDFLTDLLKVRVLRDTDEIKRLKVKGILNTIKAREAEIEKLKAQLEEIKRPQKIEPIEDAPKPPEE